MNKKCLEEHLASLRQKEKEYIVLSHQAGGAIQILEYLIEIETKNTKKQEKNNAKR